jgi:hypothetical protein
LVDDGKNWNPTCQQKWKTSRAAIAELGHEKAAEILETIPQ